MRPSPASVTAIIVTYNSQAVIGPCVEALKAQGAATLVVDNASRDQTQTIARKKGATVLACETNLGFGVASNRGAEAAQTDWLLFINPDAVVQPGAIERFWDAVETYPEAGLFGPRIYEEDGSYFFQPRSILSTYLKGKASGKTVPSGDTCVPALSGACMLMRRDIFLALGGFDPDIFLFFEDDDLCRRVVDQGYPILYVHEAVVSHLRGKSSAPNLKTAFLMRACQAWSRAYISRKYGLAYNPASILLINGLKYLVALVTFNAKRRARYGGTCAGTLRGMMGQASPR
ncbi:MAG: glycosyltransferase family 2 protein [Hyphomonadaceae bacterium]|jgi:N-acetylglucosaminyl-diphospho-decaprenol L-rhamnosyltransferase